MIRTNTNAHECINLQDRFGDRFKVEYEESYYAQYGRRARIVAPRLMIILCQHGHIYPHGGEMLGVATNQRGPVTGKIEALECTTRSGSGADSPRARRALLPGNRRHRMRDG